MVLLPKQVSGKSDTIRHLKTLRIISNEMPVLLFILCWWYFSCLQIYSDNSFNIYFYEENFSKTFEAEGDTGQFFLFFSAIIALKNEDFIKKPPSFLRFMVLIF